MKLLNWVLHVDAQGNNVGFENVGQLVYRINKRLEILKATNIWGEGRVGSGLQTEGVVLQRANKLIQEKVLDFEIWRMVQINI